MAVARWIGKDGTGDHNYGPRNFHPPKRADLRYWYKDARKVLHNRIPEWLETYRANATVDVDTIIFELDTGTLYIARKAHVR